MILDSCFLVDLMDGDEGAVAKLDELVADGRAMGVSTVSITEVERGLRADERDEFERVIEDVAVVPYDHAAARRAADLLRSLDDRGKPIGAVDAMVAATALERDGRVVTRNLAEFRRVDGVHPVPY